MYVFDKHRMYACLLVIRVVSVIRLIQVLRMRRASRVTQNPVVGGRGVCVCGWCVCVCVCNNQGYSSAKCD